MDSHSGRKSRAVSSKQQATKATRESLQQKAQRLQHIFERLEATFPDAHVLLDYSNPLELLVATILAAQCTDARVNEVTPAVFARYKSAQDYADAPLDELEEAFKPTGTFRNKAKAVKNACSQIAGSYGGKVPEEIETLSRLPGVGRKTASVVAGNAFGKPAIIVDTHVLRVSGRLALASAHNVEKKYADKVERELAELAPEHRWTRLSHLLTWHGRRICTARKPACPTCPVNEFCPWPNKTTSA